MNNIPFSVEEMKQQVGDALYAASLHVEEKLALWCERRGDETYLALAAPAEGSVLEPFQGDTEPFKEGYVLKRCPKSHPNAAALRNTLDALTPKPLGLVTSAGFGDRLGIATPGHVRALQRTLQAFPSAEIAPIFAQQSIREMTRTKRTPEDVMTDATWGTFQAGWPGPVGADADHLKTPEDIDVCVKAGFSFYTIDPGDHVDDAAHTASAATIEEKVDALPWSDLESTRQDLEARYVGETVDLGATKLTLGREAVLRAAAKYGRALAHVKRMYRHLGAKGIPFELEVSVDETETPTSHAEHVYIASELTRLGVQWVSLAPRYVGRFEKGIDYIGDTNALREDLAGHAAIARALGPYKLSLHSGSDKFSVYPMIYELTGGQVHLKTAGTSYLEALRVMANVAPKLFREIGDFARGRFETDRASYHVSAELAKVPEMSQLRDAELPGLLEQTDARQVLHVTFGSVLDRYKQDLMRLLLEHEEEHDETLARHFEKHVRPFAGGA